ncbi:hypothetical protein [Candidatus Macondimonas diazotrophica]|jgi:hypothetical protein|uniref:DUF3310 domain-containing protein n=1 Tax=Candidatus Macondimonas diazotrophica TaxID=2305248 RepID=A0A4Z0F7K7_9GAMM|nr:hypothetical protein [Candidatus Macondimonas diazotrophica]TFZ81665.1 hypothetical protein E4680_11385 [Candidatus Macondimonas diazotrophica]
MPTGKEKSDGSTASYYKLPAGAVELQDLISHRNMNAQIGEIFRSCYRYGSSSHSDELRDAKKILFYAKAEVARLESQVTSPKPLGFLAIIEKENSVIGCTFCNSLLDAAYQIFYSQGEEAAFRYIADYQGISCKSICKLKEEAEAWLRK